MLMKVSCQTITAALALCQLLTFIYLVSHVIHIHRLIILIYGNHFVFKTMETLTLTSVLHQNLQDVIHWIGRVGMPDAICQSLRLRVVIL